MEYQKIGNIQIGDNLLNAMLCIDVDRPQEAMLHFWEGTAFGAALLMKLKRQSNTIEMSPLVLYRTNDRGGLYMPQLSNVEADFISGIQVSLTQFNESLEGRWNHPSGQSGNMSFNSLIPDSVQPEICKTWDEYKSWISKIRRDGDIISFRGHGSSSFQLKTTFHRTNRNRLERYCLEVLPEFCAHAEAVLGMRFDLNNANEYAMLLGLAQHHGLPTPLLDWTSSPYIAAFFAFSDALDAAEMRPDATHVRIYGLSKEFFTLGFSDIVVLPYVSPYVSTLNISPLKNERLYAQQGQFLVTNVSNLERHIRWIETAFGRRLLTAVDIPIKCAGEALEDLNYMGLSAATMFPGLDGVCKKMKHTMIFKTQNANENASNIDLSAQRTRLRDALTQVHHRRTT